MVFKFIGRVVDRIARKAGYVPVAQLAAVIAEKEKTETELRHKTRNLEYTIETRNRMDQEIAFLRLLQLKQARGDSDTSKAVCRLEAVTAQLTGLMQDTWPAAITEDSPPEPAATKAA